MSIVSTMVIATTAAGVILSGNTQATVGNIAPQSNNYKKVIIQQENIGNSSRLKECLEKNGITLKNYENCLPGSNNPSTDKPECNYPSSNYPDCNNPGSSNQGTDKPENNKPENNKPENNKPGTDKPGIDNPDYDDTTDNSYASQVVDLVNAERSKEGLPLLTLDKKTAAAASVRAKEIKQSFSHTRPDGRTFTTVLSENGVTYKSAGENIAWGQKTPAEVVKTWMNSQGHRANILSEKFTSIGVGYHVDNGTAYWTQLFIS